MNVNTFSIKFAISQMSKASQSVLVENCVSQLMNNLYRVVEQTDGLVSFKDDIWQFRLKGESFRKIDQGQFEFRTVGEETLIKFTYYISIAPELIITSVITVLGFFLVPIILIIALPLWIQLIVKIYSLKNASKILMIGLLS